MRCVWRLFLFIEFLTSHCPSVCAKLLSDNISIDFITSTSIQLHWDDPLHPVHSIYFHPWNNTADRRKLVETNSSTVLLQDLVPGTNYTIVVSSLRLAGNSTYACGERESDPFSAVTTPALRQRPVRLFAAETLNRTAVLLSWQDVERDWQFGPTIRFTLNFSSDDSNLTYGQIDLPITLQHNDWNATYEYVWVSPFPLVHYSIQLVSANAAGNGPASEPLLVHSFDNGNCNMGALCSASNLHSSAFYTASFGLAAAKPFKHSNNYLVGSPINHRAD